MKYIYSFICLCMILTTTHAQELFEVTTKKITEKNITNFLYNIPYKKAYSGKFDINMLSLEKLDVILPEEGRIEYTAFSNTDKKWIGSNKDNTSNLIIIKSDSSVIGFLSTSYSFYHIFSFNNQDILLVEAETELSDENICGIEDSNIDQYIAEFVDNDRTAITNEPLKILIAYTPGAESLVAAETGANIKDYALLLIEMANMSYRNSGVGHRLEMAVCVKVDYEESGEPNSMSTDLSRFRNKTDGYMDEIHSLRDIYSADICVLFVNKLSLGADGIASAIGASEQTAFCVVKTKIYATNTYIFAHEIGHLQGARHDMGKDSSTSPCKYAHGYISPNKNWRTIMAYDTYCDGCKCVQYWSNPYVIYPEDGLAMGSLEFENNALVLNENTERMKSFRTIPANLSLSQSGVKNVRYGKIEATNKISTSGTVIVSPSSELVLKAPTIEMNAGFNIDLGTEIIIGP